MEKILLTQEELQQFVVDVFNGGEYAICGSGSVYIPSEKKKFISEEVCKLWPNLDGYEEWMTPGEAARTEFTREYGKDFVRRSRDANTNDFLFNCLWPMACTASYQGEVIYFDLVGAYYQLMRRLWFDITFPRGFGSLDLMPVMDRLSVWKQARNSALGITRPSSITVLKDGEIKTLEPKNKWINASLWGTVMALLHEIAYDAIKCGAIYVATDGYIFPRESKWMDFYNLMTFHFELNLRAKWHTHAHIQSWGCYYLGANKFTDRWSRKQGYPSQVNTVDVPNPNNHTYFLDWWRFDIDHHRGTRDNTFKQGEVELKKEGVNMALKEKNGTMFNYAMALMSGEDPWLKY